MFLLDGRPFLLQQERYLQRQLHPQIVMLPARTVTPIRRTITAPKGQETHPWIVMFPGPPLFPWQGQSLPNFLESHSLWRTPCSLSMGKAVTPLSHTRGDNHPTQIVKSQKQSVHQKLVTIFRVSVMLLIVTVIAPHTYWHAAPPRNLLPSPAPTICSQSEPQKRQSVPPRRLIFLVLKREFPEDKPAANLFIAHSPI